MHRGETQKNACAIATMLLCAFHPPSMASDEYKDHARSVVTETNEAFWWGQLQDQPPGGYLFRFRFDVTGDGVDELFVSSSLDSEGSYLYWTVYDRARKGDPVAICNQLLLPCLAPFYFLKQGSKREIAAVFVRRTSGFGLITRYSYRGSGSPVESNYEFMDADFEKWDEGDDWKAALGVGDEVSPRIEKILLAEYLAAPNTPWRPFNSRLNGTSQHEDAVDAKAIKAASTFSVIVAKGLLGLPLELRDRVSEPSHFPDSTSH